jgi:hypothetical protein
MRITRRQFVTVSSLVALGAVLVGRAALALDKRPKRDRRPVGCGKMSGVDLRRFYESEER